MSRRDDEKFTAVTLEGGFLPPRLLRRIVDGDVELKGTDTKTYGLGLNENVKQAAARHWTHLRGVWLSFQEWLKEESASHQGTASTEVTAELTRTHWLQALFSVLDYGLISPAPRDRTPQVSHLWQHVPIHLVSWNRGLDERFGKTGPGSKGERAPQALLQEHLNARPEHLWGILSNGRDLRLLRDSSALVGAAYLEFDLQAIFDGELFDEFALLYATLHASRLTVQPRDDGTPGTPADCWLERWRTFAHQTGIEAKDKLREQVRRALEELGTGFLETNPALCDKLKAGRHNGGISAADFEHELLRLAYQILFLFVSEDRDALLIPLPPDPDRPIGVGVIPGPNSARGRSRRDLEQARDRYLQYFSTKRLRRIADARLGDRHGDLWRGLVVVLDALGTEGGRPELALPELGGLYLRADDPDAPRSAADDALISRPDELRDYQLPNSRLLAAVRLLSHVPDDRGRLRRVDFGHLGADELGSVYESLLELVPRPDLPSRTFTLVEIAGNDRKTTGSYYTPTVLIDSLLESALDPVIDDYARGGADNLLKLTVCDPACGSGHFLVAAARRIALRYAQMYTGDAEPTPAAFRFALDKVVRSCVYGVDLNPLAVELTKVSLWLESLVPGRPLAFLDGHIRAGNALLGVTPRMLQSGIPDTAYKSLEGDDSAWATHLRSENRSKRSQQIEAFEVDPTRLNNASLAESVARIDQIGARYDLTLADMRQQTRAQRELDDSPDRRRQVLVADAWCAAFFWPKRENAPQAITSETVQQLSDGTLTPDPVRDDLRRKIALRNRFFHWHLEFPQIFQVDAASVPGGQDPGWNGGFSCVLGNPPWDRVKIQDKEFFAARRVDIAAASNKAARERLIKDLLASKDSVDLELHTEYKAAKRAATCESEFLRGSGRFPRTGRGDVNTYAVFAETARTLLAPAGRFGQVLPTGIATDATTAQFFGDLVDERALVSVLDFENEEKLFPGIDHRLRFALVTVSGSRTQNEHIRLAFRARKVPDIAHIEFTLTREDIAQLNPNTKTSPVCESPRHAQIIKGIYNRLPVIWRDAPPENPWMISFLTLFHMSNDSKIFECREDLQADGWRLVSSVFVRGPVDGPDRMIPLYEAKMVHHFDHRYGTYDGQTEAQAKQNILPPLLGKERLDGASVVPMPRYWVPEDAVEKKLARWDRGWLVGFRDVARGSDVRTMIASAVPRLAVGHKLPLMLFGQRGHLLLANLGSFVFDYVLRQKMSGASVSYFLVKQIPVLEPGRYDDQASWRPDVSLDSWVTARVLELTYTAWDMQPFAKDLNDGGPPFVWDPDRRFVLRAELDAAYFRLYGVERADVEYALTSFRAFRNKEPELFEATRKKILAVYDEMTRAEETGVAFRSELTPPPGEGLRHPASTRPKHVLASRPPTDTLFSTLETGSP
ncbi:DNA methyltransferase [Frankia sp. QA3]|uniref:Eco57I restriction-modification methylase domain-containing protein n=1 Tax=Frankia sp. QA3 TaxID=710111 RepID=UPI000269BCA4|nr:DNA methyltransferase [Frankia sp. QA3]EIV91337.1 type I restriction-modification system methyltransferase subunit [Frankia sp. QA3]